MLPKSRFKSRIEVNSDLSSRQNFPGSVCVRQKIRQLELSTFEFLVGFVAIPNILGDDKEKFPGPAKLQSNDQNDGRSGPFSVWFQVKQVFRIGAAVERIR